MPLNIPRFGNSQTDAQAVRETASVRITAPGVYDLDHETYHSDPCETPSLSSGMISDLLTAPAKCRANSKRLNPGFEGEPSDKFTIGTVAHIMFLEPHLFEERVVVCPFDSWKTKAAQAMRDEARAAGKTPIRAEHMDSVMAARNVFLSHEFTKNAFDGGTFEQSIFWRHPIYGFWCRCRPDFMAESLSHVCDYKATANADPNTFGKHAYQMGYHRRAAWYLDGCKAVLGQEPDHYWFVNQETKRPYLISVTELDGQAIEAGRTENDRAAAIFARCLETGDWHGYRHSNNNTGKDRAFRVSLPNWAYTQIDTRV